MKANTIKSPNVEEVLKAMNALQVCIPDMNKSERKELAGFLTQMADAFKAEAPEEITVPHIDEVTMNMADIAQVMIDTFGLI